MGHTPRVVKAVINPLTRRLVFRRPWEHGAGRHGPGAAGSVYTHPPPPTVAGAIASALYEAVGAGKELIVCGDREEWCDLRTVLREGLGHHIRIYSGMILTEERGNEVIRYYTPAGYLTKEHMRKYAEAVLRGGDLSEISKQALRVRVGRRHGIYVGRGTKTVVERHLYAEEGIYVPPGLRYLAIIVNASLPDAVESIRPFGGRGGTATITLEEDGARLVYGVPEPLMIGEDSGSDWALVLLTPALLSDSPWKGVVDIGEETVKRLAKGLLPSNLRDKVVDIAMPRTEETISAATTGWSLAWGKPRRPYLIIPAGTVIKLRNTSKEEAAEAIREGLGEETDIGWGTAAAIAL